ncbi:MAG: hypothetical protein H6551_00510 [Chitinophagales bacterium]|nr:hypothetical protein [Chitinophagaceae bacterium]MCB9063603.1 hypothetical protein [Chitinophagales bacterium]
MNIVRVSALLSLFIVALSVSSCCKKKVYCTSQSVDFAFTGFPRSVARTFVLKKLAVGAEWDQVIEEASFVYNGSRQVSTIREDTLYFSEFTTTGNIRSITAGNDWLIYFPSSGKIFLINDIAEQERRYEMVRCGDYETSCTRAIDGFGINQRWQIGGFAFIAEGKF